MSLRCVLDSYAFLDCLLIVSSLSTNLNQKTTSLVIQPILTPCSKAFITLRVVMTIKCRFEKLVSQFCLLGILFILGHSACILRMELRNLNEKDIKSP